MQVTVLQGSLDVLQKQLQAVRADLAAARSQQLADAQAAHSLTQQVHFIFVELNAPVYLQRSEGYAGGSCSM